MPDEFDAWVDQLQEEIDRETRMVYSEKVFRRWKNPTHVGRMDAADAWAQVTGACGDTMEIFLRICENKVGAATAFTDGCGSSMVCGSMAAEMAEGATLEEAADIRGEDVVKALDGLPDEDLHCAFLAAETLHEAIRHYFKKILTEEGGSNKVKGGGS